jgi:ribosomal protein S12 methylthiotransferase accessory factor
MSRPVVFLGPSLPADQAGAVLDADFRPPIRRGDLATVPPGSLVVIIDGVFDQDLAVSPQEIREALAGGAEVFGGASMGALRAAEVPGVRGVGRVHAWYRDGVVTRDDEVALLFDPETYRTLTVPAVNVRFAVERLSRPGTIDSAVADRILQAALRLPYTRRTYAAIVREAGLADRPDAGDLVTMLDAHDLKRIDAQAVLEVVDRHARRRVRTYRATAPPAPEPFPSRDDVLIWESGDRVTHDDLLDFLCFTGRMEPLAERALVRAGLLATPPIDGVAPEPAQAVLAGAAARWGWMSPEEARVTLGDLGVGLVALDRQCAGTAAVRAGVRAAARDPAARAALLAGLFLDGLTLKREAMRLGSLRRLAAAHPDAPDPADLADAAAVVCRANRVLDLASARAAWPSPGWDPFVRLVARARGRVRALHAQWSRHAAGPVPEAPAWLPSARKPPGERRFCTTAEVAEGHARRLGELIGVTRIGMIGELAELDGVQVAQAARPGGAWSSSYGSGKSRSRAGAVAGAVLEELEKWAQEQYDPAPARCTAYDELRADPRYIDPATLDLPYDSAYSASTALHWAPCTDLLTGEPAFLPLDVLRMRRGVHDICFTSRGSRKHLATNGLGSGFSLAEAVLHATCEYVERHAQRIAEVRLVNPGVRGSWPYRFVDPRTGSPAVRDLAARLSGRSDLVRVLDITGEIAVPTFLAVLVRDRQRADGYGTHPDPDVAMEMALLEAAQTIASATAGGREDLSIRSRSLGRHERPRPAGPEDTWFWLDPDAPLTAVADVAGQPGADIRDEVTWVLRRIRAAGVGRVLMADLSRPATAPARVVRVVIPGLETNNPFHTGPRARLALLADLVPRQEGRCSR